MQDAPITQTEAVAPRKDTPYILLGILLLVLFSFWWIGGGPIFKTSTDSFIAFGMRIFAVVTIILLCFTIRRQGKKHQQVFSLAQEIATKLEAAKKQAEESAREVELILNSAGEGIIGLDSDGLGIFANTAATRMLGFQPNELIGQPVHIITHHTHSQNTPHEIEACPIHLSFKDGKAHVKNRDIFWRKDQTQFPVKYTSTPLLDESGQLAGAVVTFNDITEHLLAEKDRLSRQVADQSNKAKSAFLAHMSHEIRTPMNAVLGCTQLLLNDQSFSTRQTELLQTIERSGGHLLNLINDILDISRIEAGQVTLNETVFCLPDLLEEIKAVFRLPAENKGLRFFMDYDEDLPHYVLADCGKLRQILVNLIGNAVKFTEMGSVVLRAHTDLTTEKTAGTPAMFNLLFEVEDTGPGIRREDLDKIFIPFEQTATAVKDGGTGLGLSISSKLVQLMGGQLTVESTTGQGSRFRFHLPIQSSEITPQQERVETQRIIGLAFEKGAETSRILVVDDSETNRTYLRKTLEMTGFEVIEASNGREAVDAFELYSPHAVLMDIQMPVMDGLEATRRLKATEKGRITPIIAITGNAFEDDRQQGIAVGMNAYLYKPFSAEALFRILKKCLHLEYRYQENNTHSSLRAPVLTAAKLSALPRKLHAALRQAIEEGDISRLRQLIAEVKESDADTALGLHALADHYNYTRLCDLLEQGENERENHERHDT
jgi:PAS domain S-box-containing protein